MHMSLYFFLGGRKCDVVGMYIVRIRVWLSR